MSSVQTGVPPAPPHPLPSRPTYDSDSNGSEGDDENDYSSDDGDAVFFGSPKPEEAQLLAKLSASILSTSSPFVSSPSSPSPSTPLPPRVRKRDSREFLRRQTLLLTTEKRLQNGSAALSERGPARALSSCLSDDSDSCTPSPVWSNSPRTPPPSSPTLTGQVHSSDLTFEFDAWHISSPSASAPRLSPSTDTNGAGGAAAADQSDSLDEDDSDKENTPVPAVNYNISEVQVMVMDEVVVSGGMAGLDLDDTQDEIAELDMGGLRLSDFEDPETGFGPSGPEAGGYRGVLEDVTASVGPRRSMDQISLGSSGSEDEHVKRHSKREQLAAPTPAHSHSNTPDPHSTPSSLDSLDSPLPVARAGPVAIPLISSHHFASIRADVASPCRNLPPSPISRGLSASANADEPRVGVKLGALDSPKLAGLAPPTHTARAGLGIGLASATPSRPTALPPPELVQKGAKLLKASLSAGASTSSGPGAGTGPGTSTGTSMGKAARPEKRAALVKTIRGQLDEAFAGRPGAVGVAVGKRSVSSGSSASTVSAASGTGGATGAGSRVGSRSILSGSTLASSSTSKSASNSASTSASASASGQAVRRTITKLAHAPAPSAPLAGSATTTNTTRAIPRPALSAKTSLPRPRVPVLSASTSVSVSDKPLTAPAGKNIPPPSSIPLKRTISQAQSQSRVEQAHSHSGLTSHATHTRHIQALAQSTLASSTPRSRPALGQPTRVFRETMPPPLPIAPLFSVGVGGAGPGTQAVGVGRTGRPPGDGMGMFKKATEKGTPRKLLGTPSRYGTPRQVQSFVPLGMGCAAPLPHTRAAPLAVQISHAAPAAHIMNVALQDVSPNPEVVMDGPPSSATRQSTVSASAAERAAPASPTPASGSVRGSAAVGQLSGDLDSVDGVTEANPPVDPSPLNEVPALAAASSRSPSPKRPSTSRRPKRTTNPPQPPHSSAAIISKTSSGGSTSSGTIVANMTEKELKMATHQNTMRNQVYHCAIDRQIVRQPGPRPPSPTSKIRTTSERDESERKKGREARAKRRGGAADGLEEEEMPVIEMREQMRGPGEDEDFVTPARPAKRAKTGDGGGGRSLKWDRNVTIIRDDGAVRAGSGSREEGEGGEGKGKEGVVGKSCLKTKVQLDHHGNVLESQRPIVDLKRTRIVVTAVFYEGEEPVSTPSSATRSKKK